MISNLEYYRNFYWVANLHNFTKASEKLCVRTEQFWERICPGKVQGHGMLHWIVSTQPPPDPRCHLS